LEQNPFVTEVELELHNVQTTDTDWEALLRVIETQETLVKATLKDAFAAENRNAPAALVSGILRAIQLNPAIRTVHLEWLRLPAGVSTFVDAASSVTSFSLCWCDFAPTDREHGYRDLAAALQRNTNIEHLELNVIYAIPILQGLRSNNYLQSLGIKNFWDAGLGSTALQQLLESTTSIQHFEIRHGTFGENFHPVAQGLIHSGTVCKLKFDSCEFQEEQFRGILQNKQNLTSLCLDRCVFVGGRSIHVTDILSSTLTRPDSKLRSFELIDLSLDILPIGQFRNLLRAVEKSKLDRFVIGIIDPQQQLFRALTQSIPVMRITELQVVVARNFWARNVKQDLLLAVMNNFSLRVVKGNVHNSIERFGEDIFDDDDKRTLVFCTDRNKRLDQWVDNPETVEQKVWPNALKLAEQAGANYLFWGLRAVLGDDSTRGGRKRKRPQFYVPS